MKYVIKLDCEEFLKVLAALQNDADRLEELAVGLTDEKFSRKFTLLARSEKALYRKILDTYETQV